MILDTADSPHKFRVLDKSTDRQVVAFGRRSKNDPHNDFLHHKDPRRMLRYLSRHNAVGVDSLHSLPLQQIESAALKLTKSTTEDWGDPTTAGFWSRWLLWSRHSPTKALAEVKRRLPQRLQVTPAARAALQNPWTK